MAAGGPFQSVNCRCRKWLPEVGMLSPTDPVFVGYKISPKRISGMLIVSRQLLRQQTGPELDRILINDLPMQLASYLDQCALYGGESADRLNRVPWVPQNVAIDLANLHPPDSRSSSRRESFAPATLRFHRHRLTPQQNPETLSL